MMRARDLAVHHVVWSAGFYNHTSYPLASYRVVVLFLSATSCMFYLQDVNYAVLGG
jgi:hypothetical protein